MPFLSTSLSAEWVASGSGSMFSRKPVRYAEKVERKKHRMRVIWFIVLFVILSSLVRSVIIQSWQIRDQAMSPSLVVGDVVLAIPLWSVFSSVPFSFSGPLHQGDLVLVDDGASRVTPSALLAVDAILRFFTFQRFSILEAQYGRNFGLPDVMRIKSIIRKNRDNKPAVFYILEHDTGKTSAGAPADSEVQASRIRAKLVFRIWPIRRVGPLT